MRKTAILFILFISVIVLSSCRENAPISIDEKTDDNDIISTETVEQNTEETVLKLEVIFEGETYEIVDNKKAAEIYDSMNKLSYTPSDDISLSDGISLYFYNGNGDSVCSYYLKDRYVKLNGMPDTYEITDSDYDYTVFRDKIGDIING